MDAVTRRFERQRLGKRDHERLGGGVERVTGDAGQQPGQRGDVDDAAPLPFDHPGQQPMAQFGDGNDQHLQEFLLLLPLVVA